MNIVIIIDCQIIFAEIVNISINLMLSIVIVRNGMLDNQQNPLGFFDMFRQKNVRIGFPKLKKKYAPHFYFNDINNIVSPFLICKSIKTYETKQENPLNTSISQF